MIMRRLERKLPLALQEQKTCLIRQLQWKAEQQRDCSPPAKLFMSGAMMTEEAACVKSMNHWQVASQLD